MELKHLIHLAPDGVDRIERGHGVLEHHGDLAAAHRPELHDLSQTGIEFVAQEIAEQIDAEDEEHDEQSGKRRRPPDSGKQNVKSFLHQ
jgi:hypothetical protein